MINLADIAKLTAPGENLDGNKSLFFATGFALAAHKIFPYLLSPSDARPVLSILFCVALYAACVKAYHGYAFLRESYYLRRAHAAALSNAVIDKHYDDYATREQRIAAGFYDGKGRILGVDLDGYILFEPVRQRPSFQLYAAAQGGGKTSTQAVNSAVLSPLNHHPGTEGR